MSFTLPRNLPSFESSQREHENAYWASSEPSHLNGNSRTTSKHQGAFFESKDLPMYKDKPYAYPNSKRQVPFYKRGRIWAACAVFATIVLWLSDPFSGVGGAANGWRWVGAPKGPDWHARREKVRDAFKLSWDDYEKHGWGFDEYHPISKEGKQMTANGMGWIIVDALDTLMIMNLTSRLSHARSWISTSLSYQQDQEVNTFETTIRMLGGLLSAHYLSSEYPDMAPLPKSEQVKHGDDLYLEKAADLADRLLGAFDSPSGVPYASINLQTLLGKESHADDGASSTAEAGSLQLEFKYLAMLMGEKTYWERVERVMEVIDANGMEDGLLPIFINPDSGSFRGSNIRLGSRGDSYYEYLIKQYLQTSNEEPIYREMWDEALAGIHKHLVTYTKYARLTILGERPDGLGGLLSPKMDHLVCFMPGTIALGVTGGKTLEETKASRAWTAKDESDWQLATELMKSCWGMYKATQTGLAPEIAHFEVDDPPSSEVPGKQPSSINFDDETDNRWRDDYIIKELDAHNLQRPETIESLFYLWRISGNDQYRDWGWAMFSAFMTHTSVPDHAGFTSLKNANILPPLVQDNMESFWLAETLKYFFLLFSPPDLLPLDSIVINTEAHIFPRFKLQRGLKTGWTRRPRQMVVQMQEQKQQKPVGKGDERDGRKEEEVEQEEAMALAAQGPSTYGKQKQRSESGAGAGRGRGRSPSDWGAAIQEGTISDPSDAREDAKDEANAEVEAKAGIKKARRKAVVLE